MIDQFRSYVECTDRFFREVLEACDRADQSSCAQLVPIAEIFHIASTRVDGAPKLTVHPIRGVRRAVRLELQHARITLEIRPQDLPAACAEFQAQTMAVVRLMQRSTTQN